MPKCLLLSGGGLEPGRSGRSGCRAGPRDPGPRRPRRALRHPPLSRGGEGSRPGRDRGRECLSGGSRGAASPGRVPAGLPKPLTAAHSGPGECTEGQGQRRMGRGRELCCRAHGPGSWERLSLEGHPRPGARCLRERAGLGGCVPTPGSAHRGGESLRRRPGRGGEGARRRQW